VAEHFGAPIVLDTSKSASWFETVLPARASNGDMVMLHLVKHPMRHVASFVNNRFVVEQKLIGKIDAGMLTRAEIDARLQYAMKALKTMEGRYRAFEKLFAAHPAVCVRLVRYEDAVADEGRGIASVLRLVGIDTPVDPSSFWSHKAHFLGGNRGVREQMHSDGLVNVAKFTRYRNEYYSAKQIAVDDKYLHTFTPDERKAIEASPVYRRLCDSLGYAAILTAEPAAHRAHA
jgi:hypothetical protein